MRLLFTVFARKTGLQNPPKNQIANCLRSIIGVDQALRLDCFKAKGMTVTRLQACVIAKHRRQISLRANQKAWSVSIRRPSLVDSDKTSTNARN